MTDSPKPLLLTGVVLAILVTAFAAVLYILDVGEPQQLQEALVKSLLVLSVGLLSAVAIWYLVKIFK
jgi:hypothetical protein